MRRLKLKKIITMGLITTSILGITSIGANAEWKKDSVGWWYKNDNGVGYKTGWFQQGSTWYYFNNDGYMKTGWLQENGKWYYLASSGQMVTAPELIDYKLNNFDKNGVWQGYLETNTGDSFTYEAAVKLLKVIDDGKFYCEGYKDNIEYTKGSYNGYPAEDKVYTINNGEQDLKYRIVGVIDKTTGEYYGVMRVFEVGYAEEYPRDTYGSSNTLYNLDGVTVDERTFDKKGDWFAHQNQTSQQTQITAADQEEMDRMSNPEYRKNHMDEYNRLVAKYSNK